MRAGPAGATKYAVAMEVCTPALTELWSQSYFTFHKDGFMRILRYYGRNEAGTPEVTISGGVVRGAGRSRRWPLPLNVRRAAKLAAEETRGYCVRRADTVFYVS